MKVVTRLFPKSANKVACKEYAEELFQKAKLIPPPEGELLAHIVAGTYCILEEVVAPSENKYSIIGQRLAPFERPVVAALYSATIWTLIAFAISEHKESEEDWVVACSSLVGELEIGSDFREHIWGGLDIGAFPSAVIALHSRYREILNFGGGMDGRFVLLQVKLLAAYQTISEGYNTP